VAEPGTVSLSSSEDYAEYRAIEIVGAATRATGSIAAPRAVQVSRRSRRAHYDVEDRVRQKHSRTLPRLNMRRPSTEPDQLDNEHSIRLIERNHALHVAAIERIEKQLVNFGGTMRFHQEYGEARSHSLSIAPPTSHGFISLVNWRLLTELATTRQNPHLTSKPFGEDAMLIREHPNSVISGNTTYAVYVCGRDREDGTWEGWIEFHPSDSGHPTLSTERETSQPNRTALEYWADGLEPVYLEGALARARGRVL